MPGKRPYSQLIALAAVLLLLLSSSKGFAHPMGNFSVNHYAKITLGATDIRLRYFIDLAEIPTYQELQHYSFIPGDQAATANYLATRGDELRRGLSLHVDGKPLALHLLSQGVIFPPGAGGLPTMKLGYVFAATYPETVGRSNASAVQLTYADANFPGQAGWKEVVTISNAGRLLSSSAPSSDRSDELTNYPTDMLNSPPQDLTATLRFTLPVPAPASASSQAAQPAPRLPARQAGLQALATSTATQTVSASISASGDKRKGNTPLTPLPTYESTAQTTQQPSHAAIPETAGYAPGQPVQKQAALTGGARARGAKSAAALDTPSGLKTASAQGRTAGLATTPATAFAPRATAAPLTRATAAIQSTPGQPAPAATPLHLQANRQGTARNAFTELVTRQHLSLWFLCTAAFISIGLGALHALEPGHGKTIVAAYLVGSKGTACHAVLLGVIVTVAHTASVFALGAITLYASRYILPEQLYPWLGVLSGLTIAALGAYMLLRRWTGEDMEHAHAAGEMHGHWFTSKKSERPESNALVSTEAGTLAAAATPATSPAPTRTVSLGQLFTLGITGGIIPCPAALVVLLSAFALHRVGFGFFLITSFSAGLAAVLIGFGLAMVHARRFITRLQIDGPLTRRWLPVASAAFMTILGAVIAVRAFATTGITAHTFSQQTLGPALFVTGLGLVLGIRHSTDPDHVVAISTIVTKQRSIRGAALIGTLWGLGHTLTIFVVGCLIILCGVVIPPRIGLAMEFSVALMLILLGVLNLTGVMQKITSHFSRNDVSRDLSHDLLPRAASLQDSALLLVPSADQRPLPAVQGTATCPRSTFQWLRPLAIGLIHGLAGSAAVALLVLATIHSAVSAVLYLVIFGAGTMLGMMGMTVAMSLPLVYAGNRLPQVSRYLGVASGLVSVCFGSFLVYQLGYLGGLFSSHPHWTPQ